MPFKFNLKKTTQAAAILLHRAGFSKSNNFMRVIKLLYLADRECLKRIGRPITGDQVWAMKRGPVLSHVYDLIKDRDIGSSEWAKFIKREDYSIRLVADPGNDELCPFEIDILQEVWDKYRSKDEWDMVNETHKLPEWAKNDPGDSSKRIPLADILEAVGRLDDLEEVEARAKESDNFAKFFES